MKNTKCPLCASTIYTDLFKNSPDRDSKIVQCSVCKHYYTLIKSEINLKELYESGVYEVVENRGTIFDYILGYEAKRIVNRIYSFTKKRGGLLDFGCGKGKFLHIAQKEGWKVKGIETSVPRANYAINIYKLEVSQDLYSKGKIDNKEYEVITLFHVLEHLDSPFELLNNLVMENLTGEGILVVEVPNINSLQAKISKDKWLHYDIPKHISHFNEFQIEKMLRKMRLEPLKYEYFSIQHGILGMLNCLLTILGNNKNIIWELKRNRSIILSLRIIMLLPVASLMEIIASIFGKGGMIRVYARKVE